MKIRNDQVLETILLEARNGIRAVMENINDERTERDKVRKISMVVEMRPNTTTDQMDVKVKTELSLVPREIKFGIMQYDENQMSFYDEEQEEEEGDGRS